MTRFARAKGSKSSNERVPEESTPWSEMKQQLLRKNQEITESRKQHAAVQKRNANYKAFLDEKEEDERKRTQWADFPSVDKTKNGVILEQVRNVFSNNNNEDESEDKTFEISKAKVHNTFKKPEIKDSQNNYDSDEPPEEHSSKVEVSEPEVKTKKTKKKKLTVTNSLNDKETLKLKKHKKKNPILENTIIQNGSEVESQMKKIKQKVENDKDLIHNKNSKKRKLNDGDNESKVKKTKNDDKKANKRVKKEKGFKPKPIVKENLTEADLKKIEKKKEKRLKQLEKKKIAKAELKKQKEELEKKEQEDKINTDSVPNQGEPDQQNTLPKSNQVTKQNNFKQMGKEKEKKRRDDKEHQRKKPFLPTRMFINGKEVQIDYIDGFPVKKEDAERLKKLRKEMISKGLPRSEINIALKLERRKAEKAFAREKKKVCFNCRKSGHNLSECPELDKGQMASQSGSGICFKCGSTEHTHFECKVVRGQEFKFASCFICNEQGHIARQCPDNARGLYPKGGACRECGDVTHLKKDCPKYQAQQQQIQDSLSLETIGDGNPDVLDDKYQSNSSSLGNRRPNKIVKF